jgi:membrane protein YqaA with SNARE-associated domain
MLRRLYDWTLGLARHRLAMPALAAVSFIESSVFPVPPDVMIIPMVIAKPRAAWRIALVATLASVAGGFAGYAIGAFLFEAIGRPLLDLYGYADKFLSFRDSYNDWGAWIVAGAGFTPFPYKVITIASGATALDPWVFGIASLLSRGARFYLEAVLLWRFGAPIQAFVEQRLAMLATVFFALLFGGFLVARYVF